MRLFHFHKWDNGLMVMNTNFLGNYDFILNIKMMQVYCIKCGQVKYEIHASTKDKDKIQFPFVKITN